MLFCRLLFVGHLQGAVSLIDLGTADSPGDRDTGKPQIPNLIDRNTGVLPGDITMAWYSAL